MSKNLSSDQNPQPEGQNGPAEINFLFLSIYEEILAAWFSFKK
jgi:hypothetical protein